MDKHRVAVDFQFSNGAFTPLTSTEPLQLYRIAECELACKAKTSFVVPQGMKFLIVCTHGSGEFSSATTTALMKTDSMIVCDTGAYELCGCAEQMNSEFLCLYFDVWSLQTAYTSLEFTALSQYFCTLEGAQVSENAAEVRRCFQDLLSELSLPQPTMLLAKGYFYQIMIEAYRQLIRHSSCRESHGVEMNAVGQTVYAIVRYIEDNLFSINNLMDMAKELGYSYNYLSHLFRRKTGMTIQAYVTQKKIEQSTRLLSDEQYSITEIAAMLNYDCIQSFSKAFRRAMGVSPTEYRAQINS